MIIITQNKVRTRNVYHLTTTDSAGVIVHSETYDSRIEIRKDEEGRTLIVPLDHNGSIRSDLYKYLNNNKEFVKLASRRQMATALNLMYTFCDMLGFHPENLTVAAVKQLMDFLKGLSVQSAPGGTKTIRHSKTVNAYYSYIKAYVTYRGWNTRAFEDKRTFVRETVIGDIVVHTDGLKDSNRLKTDPFEKYITPMHLKPEQVVRLVEVIRKAGDTTTYILVRLQVGYGLRCGEALGITIEDIKKRKLPGKEEYKYFIILRNRCSDAYYQHCKWLMHPASRDVYGSEEYIRSRQWRIEISEGFYKILQAYYRNTRTPRLPAKLRERIESETLADSVEVTHGKPTSRNYYLFVGHNGRRFSAQTYNNHLKKYFTTVGIPVDQGTKQINCSHRLRHTFAMYLTTYGPQKVNRQQLRLLMRHSNVVSSEAYFTPTEEETLKMKEQFVSGIISMIPSMSDDIMSDIIKKDKHND